MIQPKFLQQGDTIAIVAPSKRILPNELDQEITMIKDWGFKVLVGKNIYAQHQFGYAYAGTTQQRLHDFQEALDNPNIQAIWCARGGYGAIQLIDSLDFSSFAQSPKWIIGYSDITVFHTKLQQLGYQSIHGMVVKKLAHTLYHPSTYESVRQLLIGENPTYPLLAHPINITGETTGILLGGNLSILYSLLGSETSINPENKILLIEDWYENWYHVDRMMMSLQRAGILQKLRGILVGNFTRMDVEEENTTDFEKAFDPMSLRIIHQYVKDLQIPVAFHVPAGHTGHNMAMRFGAKVELKIQSNSVNLTYI
ncbi:LD-carboxypeptidase [uncultured Weeksella sp.]|uniref:S66 peptidase family protein n=1 Tax=uncultured Weeksella sp. TaxID=1161389 RepID=UPI00259B4386|nr:LD-carboxypeptidase [uncultured Weeksella sp.]